MNPYQVLGLERGASLAEIKRAYRREAMKWHPDRNADSSVARERFHQAAEAYRRLSAQFEAADRRARAAGSGRRASESRAPGESAGGESGAGAKRDSDSAHWDEMLDYAIRLAQAGHDEHRIAIDLALRGCPQKTAAAIAEKAFNIHAHYAPDHETSGREDTRHPSFKAERLENELLRTFLGARSRLLSRRETIEYYLVVFNRFRRRASANPLTWISPNRRLLRLFNFSLLLFAALAVALHLWPDATEYRLLPDLVLLQMPFALLALSFVWMVYRKLWGLTGVLLLAYFATIAYYNEAMPAAYASDPGALVGVAAVCFAPFALAVLFANYFYYHKAMKLVDEARDLFADHDERLTWMRYRAGTSGGAALLFAVALVAAMLYAVPRDSGLSSIPSFNLFDATSLEDETRTREIRQRMEDAESLFAIGEKHFHADEPDYVRAEMAYTSAAGDGSLLAAYKLGYMYYRGEGVDADPRLAHFYFEQATLSPLAFQPHSLELTTRFLAEAFNNLGIMHYQGIGRSADRRKARDMFRRGAEFGSPGARRNLERLRRFGTLADTAIAVPDYR